jgi:hypothetical protein
VEVDRHYEPPAAEAGAFKAVQRDTQWKSARSGTERDAPPLCPTLSGRAALPPSHIPSETVLVGRTPEPARGPLFIFRKILNYGKTKKSTHDHRTAKPYRTGHLPCTYPRPQASSSSTALPNLLDPTCLPCTHSSLYRPAYPIPALGPPRPSRPPCRRNQTCLPCTSTPQIAQVEAAYPAAAKNGQPCAHLRSSLPYTRPPPAQVGPRAST